ncbi:MAG: hypothetical protein V4792_21165 [Pseudomonadota bacterium]
MQRRTLLKLGLASGAVLVIAGGGAALLYEPGWHEGRLSPSGRRVLGAVARAVLDGTLPTGVDAQRAALAAHLDRMDATLRGMAPSAQHEVGDLLSLLAATPGRLALAGLSTDWPGADAADIQTALQAMRSSRIGLRRQAYHALRDLTHAAYFADRATWVQLGYPGPMSLD